MKHGASAVIKPLKEQDYDRFFSYLADHLSQNGRDGPLFQPASGKENPFPLDKQAGFIRGLSVPVGGPGWRRAWLAEDVTGRIIGHVDLRARPEPHSAHRALLGMGVRSDARRAGVGQTLVEFVLGWAAETGSIEIVDLAVLSGNIPAIMLYEKLGFVKLCEIADMFRIDGQPHGDVLMMKEL